MVTSAGLAPELRRFLCLLGRHPYPYWRWIVLLTGGITAASLVVGLAGDPEGDGRVGDRAVPSGLPEPVQPLPNAPFPDRVSHG